MKLTDLYKISYATLKLPQSKLSGFHLFVIFEFKYKLINIPIPPVQCDLVKPDFGTLHAIWLGLSLGCTLVVQLYTVHTSATNPPNADKPRN